MTQLSPPPASGVLPSWLLLAVIAGLGSAVILLGAESGILPLMLLASFHSTPLFMAGLGLGKQAVLISAAVGAVGLMLIDGAMTALGFALMSALPVIWLTRLALMSVPQSSEEEPEDGETAQDGAADDVLWYPVGRLIVWATGIAAAGVLAVFILLELAAGGTVTFLQEQAGAILDLLAEGDAQLIEGVDPDLLVEAIAQSFLMALGLSWLMAMLVGGALGQGILQRLKRNIRPGFDAQKLVLPRSLLGFAAVALLMSFMSEPWGLLGYSLLPILLAPYFLLGLATIHVISRAWPLREVLLTILYASMVFGIWPIVPVAILGLVEEAMGLRLRFGGSKPD